MHWIHDLSPYVFPPFHIGSFELAIRWYGLSYLIGIVLVVLWMRRLSKRGLLPMTYQQIADTAVWMGIGMVLGGRLFYMIGYYETYDAFGNKLLAAPWAFIENPFAFIRVWEGGMASHGGIIGLAVGGWLYTLRQRPKIPFLILADAVAAAAGLGVLCGRLANFINGELYGRPSEVWCAIKFPSSIHIPKEIVPKSPEWYEYVNVHALARHPSQLYGALLEGLLVAIIAMYVHLKHRRPGLSMGLVFVLYSLGRFFGEFFREPDPGYALFWGWMSKGQLFTLPFALIGVGIMVWALRRPARPELYSLDTPPVGKK